MTTQHVWVVSVTNDDSETWVHGVYDTEDTAVHARKQIKQQFIYDGICNTEDEVDKYYHIQMHYTPVESFADVELATPLDD